MDTTGEALEIPVSHRSEPGNRRGLNPPASCVELDAIDSTSSFARRWLNGEVLASLPEGVSEDVRGFGENPSEWKLPCLIKARRQLAGRGRGVRRWYSDEGSLTWTWVIDPTAIGLRPEQEPLWALACAAAIVKTLRPWVTPAASESLGIRWPNDVEVLGKKIGGLLPERLNTPQGPRLLLGLGLNLQTGLEHAPDIVSGMATSLHVIRGGLTDEERATLEGQLQAHFDETTDALIRNDPALVALWQAGDLLRGKSILIEQGETPLRGIARGITSEGALLLECEGKTHTLFGGLIPRDIPAW